MESLNKCLRWLNKLLVWRIHKTASRQASQNSQYGAWSVLAETGADGNVESAQGKGTHNLAHAKVI